MRELFQWVPWFEELAKKVREVQREGLVERVKKVNWAGRKVSVLEEGEDRTDPLTFFYHLAAISGGKTEKKIVIFKSVADVFGIKSSLDYDNTNCFHLPNST